ncbi:hypothetical protein E2C01_047289 [Portunus trituberculatus]|uniref:Uncharacterized protein n=1 Tax=Portunus trituberculatus TaxID=210409 RepID=A0A5B7G026_PORTR|nr:hypothetical protein [Portunus trituberculatus]
MYEAVDVSQAKQAGLRLAPRRSGSASCELGEGDVITRNEETKEREFHCQKQKGFKVELQGVRFLPGRRSLLMGPS